MKAYFPGVKFWTISKKQRQELMPQQKINKTITSYIFTSNTDVDALIPPSPLPPGFCENVQDWEV